MSKTLTVETYYAVRIGSPGRNAPYFMVRADVTNGKYTPWLFTSRADAEAQCPKQPATRVVKVRVSHGKLRRDGRLTDEPH